VLGNVSISVPAGSGLLVNDEDPDGGTVTADVVSGAATANGGAISIAADGSFSYDPPAGFEGTDSYVYTITDDEGDPGSATVSFDVSDIVWFIDNSAAGGGDGRLSSPFDTIAAFNGVQTGAQPGAKNEDVVFLHTGAGSYGDGIQLRNVQRLLGQGVNLTAQLGTLGVTIPPFSSTLPGAGGRPVITSGAGSGIRLASNNLVRGLNIGDTPNGTGVVDNGNVGGLEMDTVAITGTGGAIDIDSGGTPSITLDDLTSINSPGVALRIANTSGGASLTVSSNTTITTSGGAGIVLQNNSGGATFDLGTLASLSSSGGAGILANNSGAVTIANSPTIDATGGPAVDLLTTSGHVGGANQWTFASLSSTDSTSDGIRLNGLTHDFTVTGDTTITNHSHEGVDIDSSGDTVDYRLGEAGGSGRLTITRPGSTSNGDGINLNGVTGSFTIKSRGGGIFFTGSNDNNGIQAISGVAGLDLTVEGTGAGVDRFEIRGVSAGTGLADAHGIHTRDVENVTLDSLFVHEIAIPNSNDNAVLLEDTLTSVNVTNSDFEKIDEGFCVGAINESAAGDLAVTITGNTFKGEGDLSTPSSGGTPSECVALVFGETNFPVGGSTTGKRVIANISSNTFDHVGRAIGVVVEGDTGTGASGRNIITINNNIIEDLDNDGIDYTVGSSSVSKWVITNNVIDGDTGLGGTPNRGIDLVANVFDGVADVFIENNTLHDMDDEGVRVHSFIDPLTGLIRVLINNNVLSSAANDQGIDIDVESGHEVQATVTNNEVSYGSDSIQALVDDVGFGTGTLCLDARGNTGLGGVGAPSGAFDLDDFAAGGTFTSPQANAGAMSALNGGVTVNASGVTFGIGTSCALPAP
jgi:hypothetical protein